MIETSRDSGELLVEDSPDILLPATSLFGSKCSPSCSCLFFPALRSLPLSELFGVLLPNTLSLRKPPPPPPPPDILILLLRFFSLPLSPLPPSSLLRSGVKNLSFSLSPFSLHLSPLARLPANELPSPCRRASAEEEKLTSAAGVWPGSAEERLASPDMARSGVSAVQTAGERVRSLQHCPGGSAGVEDCGYSLSLALGGVTPAWQAALVVSNGCRRAVCLLAYVLRTCPKRGRALAFSLRRYCQTIRARWRATSLAAATAAAARISTRANRRCRFEARKGGLQAANVCNSAALAKRELLFGIGETRNDDILSHEVLWPI